MDSTPFYLSYAALWILVILHSLILLGVVRIIYQLQQNGVVDRNTSISIGQEAPVFSAKDLSGISIGNVDFAGRLTALLFVSPDCPACKEILEDDMAYLSRKAQGNLIVICQADHENCKRLIEQYELSLPVVADDDEQIGRLFNITSIPTTVLINDNRIQSYGQPEQGTFKAMEKEPEDQVLTPKRAI